MQHKAIDYILKASQVPLPKTIHIDGSRTYEKPKKTAMHGEITIRSAQARTQVENMTLKEVMQLVKSGELKTAHFKALADWLVELQRFFKIVE